MNFIFSRRFNYFDGFLFLMIGGFIANEHYWLSLIMLVSGILFSVLMEWLFTNIKRNRKWQELAKVDRYVDAIKEYRATYNCSLKEAADAVRQYQLTIRIDG